LSQNATLLWIRLTYPMGTRLTLLFQNNASHETCFYVFARRWLYHTRTLDSIVPCYAALSKLRFSHGDGVHLPLCYACVFH
jgi:hypothetical protein